MSEASFFPVDLEPATPEESVIFSELEASEQVDMVEVEEVVEEGQDEDHKKHTPHFPKAPALVGDLDWQLKAACRPERVNDEPLSYYEAFDGEGGEAGDRLAKRKCFGCVVVAQCLTYALDNNKHVVGVWGGTNESERRRLLSRRL